MAHPDTGAPAPTSASPSTAGEPALKTGVLSPRQALFFGLSGIGVPLVLAGQGGTLSFSAGWSSWLAMVIGSAMIGLLASIVVRFSRRHLATGSLMSYLNLEVGRGAGSLTGAALFAGYLAALMLFVSTALVFLLSFLTGIGITVTSTPMQVTIALVLLAVCVVLARRGVTLSVNTAVTLSWIGMPVVLVIIVAAVARNGIDLAPQLALQDFTMPTFIQGVVLAFGTFCGFEGFTALAQETSNPRRTIPRLVATVVAVIAAVAVIGVLLTLPTMMANPDALIAGASPLSILAVAGGMSTLGTVTDALLFLATVGSLLVYVNDAGRIVATAARDGLLPRAIGHVDEKRRTPSRAIVFVGLLAVAIFTSYLMLTGEAIYTAFIAFATMTSYSWAVAYIALGVTGVIDASRTRSPGFGVAAFLAVVATTFVLAYPLSRVSGGGSAAVVPWAVLGTVGVLWVAALLSGRGRPATEAL